MRVSKANCEFDVGQEILSNGEGYRAEDCAWIEVAPVKWLVDEKARIMIAEKILFAGIQIDTEKKYHASDFEKTNIKQFMDNIFATELIQDSDISQSRKNEMKKEGKTNESILALKQRLFELEKETQELREMLSNIEMTQNVSNGLNITEDTKKSDVHSVGDNY